MFKALEMLRYLAYLEIVKALDRLRRARTQPDREDAALSALLLLPPDDFAAVGRVYGLAAERRLGTGGAG